MRPLSYQPVTRIDVTLAHQDGSCNIFLQLDTPPAKFAPFNSALQAYYIGKGRKGFSDSDLQKTGWIPMRVNKNTMGVADALQATLGEIGDMFGGADTINLYLPYENEMRLGGVYNAAEKEGAAHLTLRKADLVKGYVDLHRTSRGAKHDIVLAPVIITGLIKDIRKIPACSTEDIGGQPDTERTSVPYGIPGTLQSAMKELNTVRLPGLRS